MNFFALFHEIIHEIVTYFHHVSNMQKYAIKSTTAWIFSFKYSFQFIVKTSLVRSGEDIFYDTNDMGSAVFTVFLINDLFSGSRRIEQLAAPFERLFL